MNNPNSLFNNGPARNQSLSPVDAPVATPRSFAGRIRALQQIQHDQAALITRLDRENNDLKESQKVLLDRVQKLEEHNVYLTSRRKELVAQLNNQRTLHQEADNAFMMRKAHVEPDDLEGMLGIYNTMVTTAINYHQHAMAQFRTSNQAATAYTAYSRSQYHHHQTPAASSTYHRAYPPAYSEYGYCHAHNMPYRCNICK